MMPSGQLIDPDEWEKLQKNLNAHPPGKPFCDDPKCSCHESFWLIWYINQFVQEGLLTPDEATRIVEGKSLPWEVL